MITLKRSDWTNLLFVYPDALLLSGVSLFGDAHLAEFVSRNLLSNPTSPITQLIPFLLSPWRFFGLPPYWAKRIVRREEANN